MTSDHSVSTITRLKAFWMLIASTCFNINRISIEVSFIGDSNEETLNVNKFCWQ